MIPLDRIVHLLQKYMFPQYRSLGLLAFGMGLALALSLINPQVMRYFIDAAIDTSENAPPLSSLTIAASLYLGVALTTHVLGIGTSYLSSLVGWNSTNSLREDLAAHCLKLDMSFHKSKTPGEMIQRIDGDVSELGEFFSSFLLNMTKNVLLLVGILIVLLFENVVIGLVLTINSIVLFAVIYSIRNIAVTQNVEMMDAQGGLFGFIEERLSGKEDIRALGAIPYVLHRLYIGIHKVYRKSLSSGYMGGLIEWIVGFAFAVNYAIALALGTYFFFQGDITLGTAFMFVLYLNLLGVPIMEIRGQVLSLQRFRAALERVDELFTVEIKITDGIGSALPPGAMSVRFEGVNFSYTKDNRVLEDISFNIKAGQVLGLLGRTGSGKSTLAKLLFRFYDPDNGVIKLSGQPIQGCCVKDLRSRVGLATQDVQLFHGTVRDNLTFFDPTIDDSVIMDAAHHLSLSSWIEGLPNGLDTIIGAGDFDLSSGEKQLLAFVRVFLKQPGLLILDEASSRLDPASEKQIESAVDELLKGQTAIIIAHRLETVRRADQIMILEDGKILEMGDRLALESDKSSHFSRLLSVGFEEERV